MSESEFVDLQPGQKFRHGQYFSLEVRQEADGVYPFVRTGEATMILPWRYANDEIYVCLLQQERVDTGGGSILKVCGGYNGDQSKEQAGLAHLLKKTGYVPDQNNVVWWRECLGVGPQYQFPIWYGFLKDPKRVGNPRAPNCLPLWMPLAEACRQATQPTTDFFFDDLSTAMLLVLLVNHEQM